MSVVFKNFRSLESIMQSRNRVLTDFAKVADGALSAVSGVKGEVEGLVRAQIERILLDMDLVPREEFEVVKAMATKAREENEALSEKIAELEALMEHCGAKDMASKATPKKAAPRKRAAAKGKASTARRKPAAKSAAKKDA